MGRASYSETIANFLDAQPDAVLGRLVQGSTFAVEQAQRDAWLAEIEILKGALRSHSGGGTIYFEYVVPRLGKRIDAVVVLRSVVFVLEFKVGEQDFAAHAVDQVRLRA
jgi:hypothetical protein